MKRVVPGLAMAAIWLFLLLSGSFFLYWFILIMVTLFAGHEYLKMACRETVGRGDRAILTSAMALPVVMAGLWHEAGMCGGLFISFLLCVIYILIHYSRLTDCLAVLSRLGFGCLYIGFLLAHLVVLYFLPEGNVWLILLVAVTAGSDSGAYFFGKQFGRHKLCRHISPNKTIEGAVGGILSGVLIALIFAAMLLESVAWKVLIPTAVILSVVGIMGDLCESIIKRGTDTKDSGTILLGHGGVLDRVDSLLLAAPTLYYLYVITG